MVAYHTLKKETTVKKMMKWTLRVVLSLALLVGFGALDARPSWALPTDVFDLDSSLYVPYWRVDPTASINTFLIIENPWGPEANPVIRFYNATCTFVKDYHPTLTTGDVELINLGDKLAPLTGEGGIVIAENDGVELSAETLVVNFVDGSILRFHHINENGSGEWNVFANFWTGAYFDANAVDNELFLFCPGPRSNATGTYVSTDLRRDLITLADSPIGNNQDFTKKVDILFFDADETLLVTVPLGCTCVTRVALESLTSLVKGTSGRIFITSTFTGGDFEDFIAFMKRKPKGSSFDAINGYMFSSY